LEKEDDMPMDAAGEKDAASEMGAAGEKDAAGEMDAAGEKDAAGEMDAAGKMDATGETEATHDQEALPDSPPHLQTPSSNASNSPPDETATSTSAERDSALRVLRSKSDSTSKSASSTKSPRANHRLKSTATSLRIDAKTNRSILSLRKSRQGPLGVNNVAKMSPKTQNAKIFQKGTPPKTNLGKKVLIRNAAKSKGTPSPQRQTTPKHSGKAVISSKVKKSPAKHSPQRNKQSLTKVQKKSPVNVKNTSSSIKKNTKVIAKSSPKKASPSKGRNDSSGSSSRINQSKAVSNAKANKDTANQKRSEGTTANKRHSSENTVKQSVSKGSKGATSTVSPSSDKPMDKYIDLDFLLNANQLMSELVADSSREEGTLDTASEAERRHIVDLAKLYRLRVRMGGNKGELPVALIKGRESSLPHPGQVDSLLHKMTHAMVIKTQIAKSKEQSAKRKLSSSRRSMASPTKKRRV
jgi:hypothetical protein